MKTLGYQFATVAAAIAVAGLAGAAPAPACEAHQHQAADGTAATPIVIVQAPTDLSKASGERGPQTMRLDLMTDATGESGGHGTSTNEAR